MAFILKAWDAYRMCYSCRLHLDSIIYSALPSSDVFPLPKIISGFYTSLNHCSCSSLVYSSRKSHIMLILTDLFYSSGVCYINRVFCQSYKNTLYSSNVRETDYNRPTQISRQQFTLTLSPDKHSFKQSIYMAKYKNHPLKLI